MSDKYDPGLNTKLVGKKLIELGEAIERGDITIRSFRVGGSYKGGVYTEAPLVLIMEYDYSKDPQAPMSADETRDKDPSVLNKKKTPLEVYNEELVAINKGDRCNQTRLTCRHITHHGKCPCPNPLTKTCLVLKARNRE